MTIQVAQGTVTITTGAVGTTFDITTDGAGNSLSGFHTAAARAIIFTWSGRATTGFAEDNARFGMGFATGTSARRAQTSVAAHGVGAAVSRSTIREDCCIATAILPTAVGGLADLDAIITDGFRLRVDDQFPAALVVSWMAIWGDELETGIVSFTSKGSTGTQDLNVGLALDDGDDDKAVFFIGGSTSAVDAFSFHGGSMCGVAAGDTPVNAVLFGTTEDGAADTVAYGYCRSGSCIALSTTTDAITQEAAVSAWLPTGFRLNWNQGSSANYRLAALALKGPQFKVGSFTTRTDTNETDVAVGFDPLGVMVGSHSKAESSADTTQPHHERSVGFATGATSRSVAFMADQDAVTTTDIGIGHETNAMYTGVAVTAGTKAIDAHADIVDMTASGGGFTFKMDDIEPSSGAFAWYLAIGAIAGTLISAPAVTHSYTAPAPAPLQDQTIQAPEASHACAVQAPTLALNLMNAPALAYAYAAQAPLIEVDIPEPVLTFPEWLDQPNAERRWLLELDVFSLAPTHEGLSAMYSGPAYSELAYSEGEGGAEGATRTLYFADHGYTSLVFTETSGYFLDVAGPDDGTLVAMGIDFITDEQIGDAALTLTRASIGARRRPIVERYASLPGHAGSYIWAQDSNANSITGDIHVRAKVAAARWAPAAGQAVVAKYGAAGQRSYKLSILSNGCLWFGWSPNGTTEVSATSTIPTGFSNGAVKHIGAKLDANNGAGSWTVNFEYSDDGETWTPLGAAVVGGSAAGGTILGIEGKSSISGLDTFETWLGRDVYMIEQFVAWKASGWPGIQSPGHWYLWESLINSRPGFNLSGAVALSAWNVIGNPSSGATDTMQQIAQGSRDSYWRTLARNVYDNGLGDIYMRLGWEMDGSWYPWASRDDPNASWFGAAYRRVVDVMRSERPNNTWKFGICVVSSPYAVRAGWLDKIWPGAGYVSYVGIDAYDRSLPGYPMPASADTPSERLPYWQNAWSWLLGRLNTIKAFADSKGVPIVFNEWGVSDASFGGQDNTYYIQKMYDFMAANNVLWQSYLDSNPGGENIKISPTTVHPNASDLYQTLFSVEPGGGAAPTTTSIFNSTSRLEIGSSQSGAADLFVGLIYSAEVRNGIDGPIVAFFHADDGLPSTMNFASTLTGETWTLAGAARIIGAHLETVPANVRRDDYDPATLERIGLLRERETTNVVAYSADASNAWWTQAQGVSVAADTHHAPDGTLSADTITDATATDWANVRTPVIALPGAGVPICNSIYVRKDSTPKTTRFGNLQLRFLSAGGTVVSRIDLAFASDTGECVAFNNLASAGTSTVTGFGAEDEVDCWRVWVSGYSNDANAAQYTAGFFPAHGAGATMNAAAMTAGNTAQGSMAVWGWQVEENKRRPSSYVPTSGAAVTRQADLPEIANIAGFYDQTEGAVYIEAIMSDVTAAGYLLSFRDAPGTDRIGIKRGAASTLTPADILTQLSADATFASQPVGAVQVYGASPSIENIAETGIHGTALPNGETMRFGKVLDPDDVSRNAFFFQVYSTDPTTSGGKRAEFKIDDNIEWGETYWIAFSIYIYDWGTISEGAGNTSLWGCQCHTGSATEVGGPSFGLYTRNNGRDFRVQARTSVGPDWNDNAVVTTSADYPIPFGQWTDFVLKFKHSRTGTGLLQCWMNGAEIFDYAGDLGYDLGVDDYMKFGYYNFAGTMQATARKLLERSPAIVHDPTGSTYSLSQIETLLHPDVITYEVFNGGVEQASLDVISGIESGEVVRVAAAYKADDFAANGNGLFYGSELTQNALTDTAGGVPTVDRLTLGCNGSSDHFDGWLRRVYYFAKRLADATLRDITAAGPVIKSGAGGVPGVDPDSAIYYEGRLLGDFRIERRIVGREGIGGLAVVVADGALNNEDGAFDYIMSDFSMHGRAARLYVGQPRGIRSDFELVMSGTVERAWVNQKEMRLQFSDGIARLDRKVNITTYAGSGGLEGGADLKGKYRPMAYGAVFNITPPLVRNDLLIYQVHMGTTNDVPAVYDRGISLTKGSDYSSQSDMENNAPSAGQYRVWKGGGYFRLGSTPAGTVTADVEGDATGSYITKAGEIVKRILESQLQLTGDEIDSGSFTSLDSNVPAPVGIWSGTEGLVMGDAVNDLLAAVGAFGGFNRLGKFTVGRVEVPTTASGIIFTEEDIISIERLPLPPAVDPIAWRGSVAYAKNYTVQTDFAAAVTAARRSFCAEPFRSEKDEDVTMLSRHRLAREYTNANLGLYRDQADALAEARRLMRLWGVERNVYLVTLPARALVRDLGDVVTLQHSRYRMQSGRNASVLGHVIKGPIVELTVLV